MKKRIMARAGAVGLLVAGSIAVPALASPALASCSHAHSNLDSTVGSFIAGSVNTRQGPHTTCASNGHGQVGDGADYWCYTHGQVVSGTDTWTWVRNTRTGVQGWVHDSFLSGFGSFVPC